MRLLAIFFLFTTALGLEDSDWIKDAESRIDEQAVLWLRQQINPEQKKEELQVSTSDLCKNCFKGKGVEIEEPKLLVFISFSVPENIWLNLSMEMVQKMADYHAIFVLRGFPENSFRKFASKITHLKEKGMGASIQINPMLFKEHGIDRVPAFVFLEDGEADKLSGAVSIAYGSSLLKKKMSNKHD